MRTALLLVILFVLAILSRAAGFGPYRLCQGFVDLVGDKLEWRSRSIAGKQGVNCGRVDSGHDAGAANDCVRNSLALGKAFRVRYKLPTIESSVSVGLVRSPHGHVYEIIFDGNPENIGRFSGDTSLFRQQIVVQECSSELQVTHGGRLTCIADRGF
jgi:hypothetical protein